MADDSATPRKRISEPHDGATPSIASLEGAAADPPRPSFNDPLPRGAPDETTEERSPSRRADAPGGEGRATSDER